MNYSLAFQQGVYGFIVAAAFLLCTVGVLIVSGAIAGVVGSIFKRLDDDGGDGE